MELSLGHTEIPTVTRGPRAAEPNPFDGAFPADEKAVTVTLPNVTDDDGKAIRKAVSFARKAANSVDRTARIVETVEGKGKNVTMTLTIWTVTRQTRPGSGNHKSKTVAETPVTE